MRGAEDRPAGGVGGPEAAGSSDGASGESLDEPVSAVLERVAGATRGRALCRPHGLDAELTALDTSVRGGRCDPTASW